MALPLKKTTAITSSGEQQEKKAEKKEWRVEVKSCFHSLKFEREDGKKANECKGKIMKQISDKEKNKAKNERNCEQRRRKRYQ